MPSVSDVQAGGAWLEVTAKTKPLEQALSKCDAQVRNFAKTAQAQMSSLGSKIGASAGKSFALLNVALGVAAKGMRQFGQTVGDAMQRLRDSGTDEQRESILKLDAAVSSVKEKFMTFLADGVGKLAGPATQGIERMTEAWNHLKSIIAQIAERFSGFFNSVQSAAQKISETWDKLVNKAIERSPMLAKAATDALKKSGEDAMSSWAKDNSLLEELDRINDKQVKSAEEISRANDIVAQLKSRWGDVGIEVDQVTGQIKGLDEAQRTMMAAQNKARIAQLKLEQMSLQTQLKAVEAENQRTMAKAGPGTMSILGGWLANTAGVVAGGEYKSMTEVAEEKNNGAFEAARATVDATRAQQDALRAQSEALDEQIKAMEAGQDWYEQAGRAATEEAKKTPVGTNTRAGSMVDKYAGMSPAEAEVEKLNDQYAKMLADRIEEIRKHGYSEEEATQIATEEFAADRKAVDERIAKIREDAAKKEADILAGGDSILKEAADTDKTDLEKELDGIEQRYIDVRKQMIDQLMALGKTEEEAAKAADEHLKEEREATDKLKQLAIKRDEEAKAQEEAERIQQEAAEAKKAEIEAARAYLDDIEKGLAASERSYASSGGTFNAFDELDTRNIAAESLDVEKQQLKQQKDMVDRMRELIDLYEQTDTTAAVFA